MVSASRARLASRLTLGLLVLFTLSFCGSPVEPTGTLGSRGDFRSVDGVRWLMPALGRDGAQSDTHILRMPNGKVFLIDVGDERGDLIQQLAREGVQSIDTIVISHAHKDHYGGLATLLRSRMPIGRVLMNTPRVEVCNREIPWGCDYRHVTAMLKRLTDAGIEVAPMQPGDLLFDESGARLEVLYAFDGSDTPVGATDINDTSAILSLTYGPTTVLFTGDLNRKLGAWLAKNSDRIRADILKVPHHGTESVAPDSFFERVAPKLVLVPSPAELWLSMRSKRVRDYFRRRRAIDVRVAGIDGDVTVQLRSDRYTVESARRPFAFGAQ